MNNVLYIAAAFAIGICVSLQPPVNSVMSRSLENPLLASTISIFIAFIFAVAFWLSWGKRVADLTLMKALPWWIILGGIVGVAFVVGGVVVAPVVGMALFFVCVVGIVYGVGRGDSGSRQQCPTKFGSYPDS